ncbi:MAG: hypothetical protein QXJ11_03220 [Candidatus Bathyarchaeia archaeon]
MNNVKNKRAKIFIPTKVYENLGDQAESIIRKGLLTLRIQILAHETLSLKERITYLKKRVKELPNDIKRDERMLEELIEDQEKLEALLNGKG